MRNLKKLAFVLSIVIFAGAVSAASDCYVVSATSNTQQQIDQAEQDKKDLEDKLDQNEQELNGLKNDQKNPIYPSVLFSCMTKQVNLMFNAKQGKAL